MKKVIKNIKIIILILLLAISAVVIFLMLQKKPVVYVPMYAASATYSIDLLDKEYKPVTTVIRGTKIDATDLIDDLYYPILYNDIKYFVAKTNLVVDIKDIALEGELYVRTPSSIYLANNKLSLVKKGVTVEVLSYEGLNADGSVDKYLVKYNDLEGYIYSKYLVTTHESAILNYDQDGKYKIHSARTNTQGGGSGGNLDFYPVVKEVFENNVMPTQVRSLYINGGVINSIDQYIALAKTSNINAFVVDIKDDGAPAYKSPVMQKYSPTNYNHAINSFDTYKAAIKKLKDNGFYVIGRITTFKDSYYITDHPENAILDNNNSLPFRHNGSYWPTAFKRDVWVYNVELAKEAVVEMGFNEIQFDYVRFPDQTYYLEKSGRMNLRNDFAEDKAQAIQGFVMYAADELHKVNAYISIDVFGESAHSYVTGYGQYWGAISNVVDAISPMPYPDHFGAHEYGISEIVWTVPYKLISLWAKSFVNVRQSEIPTPAVVRSWIQAFNTTKPPYLTYGPEKIGDQIQALHDAGLTGGYITWNSGSSLSKYASLAPAFKREY